MFGFGTAEEPCRTGSAWAKPPPSRSPDKAAQVPRLPYVISNVFVRERVPVGAREQRARRSEPIWPGAR